MRPELTLTAKQEWDKGDIDALVRDIHPWDREECKFHNPNIKYHILQTIDDMQDHIASVHDNKGRLWWLGGVVPSYSEEHPNSGFAWLLKTKWAKPKYKKERKVMRAALQNVMTMAKDAGYTKIANIIWDQQRVNLRWLESEGFIIDYNTPAELLRPDGKRGIFYRFAKEL